MAGNIILRQCSEDDIAAVLDLWRAAGSTPSVTDTTEQLRVVIDSNASSLILAVVDGKIAGSVIPAFDGWRGNVYRLAVHPEFQRQRNGSETKEPSAWARWWKKTILGLPGSGNPRSLSWNRWI